MTTNAMGDKGPLPQRGCASSLAAPQRASPLLKMTSNAPPTSHHKPLALSCLSCATYEKGHTAAVGSTQRTKRPCMTDTPYSISLNTPYRSVECQYAVLSSQNTPYCLEKQIRHLDNRIQYAVLGRRFDTSYPTGGYGVCGGYGVSGDQSEQNTI
ncbi:hypothetical protein Tco_0461441 [Tanacetum coccineum]